CGLLLTIDSESYAGSPKDPLGILHLFGEPRRILRGKPVFIAGIGLPQPGICRMHLIKRNQCNTPIHPNNKGRQLEKQALFKFCAFTARVLRRLPDDWAQCLESVLPREARSK